MRARMGFAKAFLYGTGAFAAVTAAFFAALSIAITGPPTQSEANGLQAAAGDAANHLQHAARRVGAGVCHRIPDLVRIGACPAPQVQQVSFTPSHHHVATPTHAAPIEKPPSEIVPVADTPPEPSFEPSAESALSAANDHTRAVRPQRRVALAGARAPHAAAHAEPVHAERIAVSARDTHRTAHAAHAPPVRQLAAAAPRVTRVKAQRASPSAPAGRRRTPRSACKSTRRSSTRRQRIW